MSLPTPTAQLIAQRGRYPRLGIIRLGIQVPTKSGEKMRPAEVEYFVCPPELRRVLGEKPLEIPVLFPDDHPARLFPWRYERYSGALVTRICDGTGGTYTEIPVQGEPTRGPCEKEPMKACPCKATAKGRLNVIVIDGPVGTYQVLIGGEQRIADLTLQLWLNRKLLGRLTDVPFVLRRVSAETQIRDSQGKRLAKTGWPVRLEAHFSVAQVLRARGLDPHDLTRLPGLAPPAPLPPGAEDLEPEAEPEEALVPGAQAENGGLADELRLLGADAAEFDISLAFRVAQSLLGIQPADYRRYLEARYRTDVDNLPPLALAQERTRLVPAVRDTALAQRLREEILAGRKA